MKRHCKGAPQLINQLNNDPMKFCVLFLVLLISGCVVSSPISSNYDRLAGSVNKKIRREIPVVVSGFGAMIPKQIHAYAMDFKHEGPISIDLGRCYVLRISQIALDAFNSDDAIQEHLENRPFTVNNLSFAICSSSWMDYSAPFEFVDRIGFSNGTIFYKRYDHVTEKFVILFTETYEEALQKCPSFIQPSQL